MELVEGQTLAELIAQRPEGSPIEVTEALDIARQIAEALEAAHEAGSSIAISSRRTSRCVPTARSRSSISGWRKR